MLFDADRKLIVYEGEDVERVADLAKLVKGGYAVLDATYRNLLELARREIEAPDPMEKYDWPRAPGEEPFPTQKIVSSFMVVNPRSFVLSDMRTGKTRAALWAADWLMSRSKVPLKCLVVSDITALSKSWGAEIAKQFFGRRTHEMVYGSAAQRVSALARPADFYLINHDGLRIGAPKREVREGDDGRPAVTHVPSRSVFKAMAEKKFDIVIFDEAATYRSHTTGVFKAARAVSRESPYVWLLTGTPDPNGPEDANGLKMLCHPTTQLSFKKWRDSVVTSYGQFDKPVVKDDAAEKVDELLKPAIRINQSQCFDQPPAIFHDVSADMTEEQKSFMRKLKQEFMVQTACGGTISAVNAAALRTKLIQIGCGVVYDVDHQERFIDASPRLDTLCKLVGGISGKVIIFSPLTSVTNMIARRLGDIAVSTSGISSRNKKLELLHYWQSAPDKKALVSHPGPIARGVDLTSANVIIWYSPTDRVEYYLQANQRINGIKQKKRQHIIKMSCNPIEKDIYSRLEDKADLQSAILKLKEFEL